MNIIVIGAGQIGSRHIQSLCTLENKFSLDIIDPSTDSISNLKKILANSSNLKLETKELNYFDNLDQIKENYDFAIIATSSNIRKNVSKELLEKSKIRYVILEKFLFPRLSDYDEFEESLVNIPSKIWVNCSRREMDIYKEIKAKLTSYDHLSFNASGSNWSIGSNSIHLIDIFSYLTNSTDLSIQTDFLDPEIIPNKRSNYIDFTGTLVGKNANNDTFSLSSFKTGVNPSHIVITTDEITYVLNESKGIGFYSNKSENIFDQQFTFKFPYQSELTVKYFSEIFKTGSCNLPSYNESEKIHKILLQSLIEFSKKISNNQNLDYCLIT